VFKNLFDIYDIVAALQLDISFTTPPHADVDVEGHSQTHRGTWIQANRNLTFSLTRPCDSHPPQQGNEDKQCADDFQHYHNLNTSQHLTDNGASFIYNARWAASSVNGLIGDWVRDSAHRFQNQLVALLLCIDQRANTHTHTNG
jgi:hypothetical protein